MHHRIAGILTGAVALSLVASGIAVADSVSADADVVVAGDQGLINLGHRGARLDPPGADRASTSCARAPTTSAVNSTITT